MHARRFQADEHVACRNVLAVDDFLLIDNPHRKACEVVLAVGIETRHLRRFAADERTARLLTALCDALYNVRFRFGIKSAASVIIEEEQGLCALANDVVYTHRHRVDTDRVVLFKQERVFEFRTHAVRTCYEYGLFHFFACDRVKTAKRTEIPDHVAIVRGFYVFFHELYRFVASRYVNAAVLIRNRHNIYLLLFVFF